MRRTLILSTVIALVVSACASSPSIWGVAPTPTPNNGLNVNPPPFDPFTVNDSLTIFPTSTIPPEIATELAYTPTSTPVEMPPLVAPTYTPSLDTAPYLYY